MISLTQFWDEDDAPFNMDAFCFLENFERENNPVDK